MKRKRNLIISASYALAFFVALAGCSKGDGTVGQQPVNVEENNEVAQPKGQQAELQTKTSFVGEITTKKSAIYMPKHDTLEYTTNSTVTMAATGNASSVGLDAGLFEVNADKGDASGRPGLNKDGTIRLYCASANGNGSRFEVVISEGYEIVSISVNYNTNASKTSPTILAGGNTAVLENGAYIIDGRSFVVKNGYTSESDSKDVYINSIVITYEEAAKLVATGLLTHSSLSYSYTKAHTNTTDTLTKANTYPSSGSGYQSWTTGPMSSGVEYAGKSSTTSIQLRGSDSGIVTTANPNGAFAKTITINWRDNTSDGRTISIYGKNTAYSSTSDLFGESIGALIGSATYVKDGEHPTNIININNMCRFIGIKASDALYIDSIEIEWEEASFTYSDVAIRFGGFTKKSLWDRLETESDIKGYGVMFSTPTYLSTDSIEDKYDAALLSEGSIDSAIASICTGNNIKNFYKAIPGDVENPALATDEQKGETSRNFYIWNLYKNISLEDLDKGFTAVAYIRIDGEVVFLNETTVSAVGLASDVLDSGNYLENAFDGSLYNLANLA